MAGRIAYYGGIVTDGLVLHLDAAKRDSYPGSGTVWRDLSGNGNNGALVNGPTFDRDSGNGGLGFDGVNDYVIINDETNLNLNFITVSVWIKPIFSNMVSYANVINKLTGNSFNGWSLERYGNSTNISWWVGDGSVNTNPWSSNNITTSLTDNQWQHIVGLFDGEVLKLYKNSLLVNERNSSMGILEGDNKTHIGKHGLLNYYWKGNVPQVCVYNRALTPTEITQNYNALKSRFGL